jgi:hypothetical protein
MEILQCRMRACSLTFIFDQWSLQCTIYGFDDKAVESSNLIHASDKDLRVFIASKPVGCVHSNTCVYYDALCQRSRQKIHLLSTCCEYLLIASAAASINLFSSELLNIKHVENEFNCILTETDFSDGRKNENRELETGDI